MSISGQNLSVVIVTFKSEKVIDKCINSIGSNVPIIILENSNNQKFKLDLESKYQNLKCILSGSNLGMGAGNNIGIRSASTDYVFILNPDVILESNTLDELFFASKKLPEFTILSPINTDLNFPNYKVKKVSEQIIDSATNKVVVKAGSTLNFVQAKKLYDSGLREILLSNESIYGKFLHKIVILDSDETIPIGSEINKEILDKLVKETHRNILLGTNEEFMDGPPCLALCSKTKLDDGRDRFMYNYMVFAKKKYKDKWPDQVSQANYKYLTSPSVLFPARSCFITCSIHLL